MLAIPRTFLALGLAVLTGAVCASRPIQNSTASRRVQSSSLHPPASQAELWLAAYALRDSTRGPLFAPGQLSETVRFIRRLRREYPVIAGVVAPDTSADDLSTRTQVKFQLSDSLSRALCGTDTLPPLELTEWWRRPPRLGLARFDSITDALGGARAMRLRTSLDRCYVTVVYEQLLNEPGAERAYAALRPDIDRPVFYMLEKMWNEYGIRIRTGDSVWRVRILTGWGDCIGGGCIYHHTWEFTYDRATGRIEKVLDSGPPLPRRPERIGH